MSSSNTAPSTAPTCKIPLVRLKLRPDTPQTYEDIHYNDITLTNIKGTFASFGTLHGNPGDTLSNITLENINVTFTDLNPTPPPPPHCLSSFPLSLYQSRPTVICILIR